MRVLVCGGRDFTDRGAAVAALDRLHANAAISLVIQGAARSADQTAGARAQARGVAVAAFPDDWAGLGRKDDPIRNPVMKKEGHPALVVALPGGRGTGDRIARAKGAGGRVLRPLG